MPPAVHTAANGTRYLAPTDGNAGGTWLLANEHGLTLAILNFYEREPSPLNTDTFRSRGLFMTDLAGCATLDEVAKHVRPSKLSVYKAFTLLAFSKRDEFQVWRWQYDGENLFGPDRDPELPVCSSSFQPVDVTARRRAVFTGLSAAGPLDREGLLAFHHSDGGKPDAFTVKMSRPDAQTWSISRVTVTHAAVKLVYEELPPHQEGSSKTHTRALARTS